MLATDRCHRLAVALKSMSTRIPYEDAQIAAIQLTQCAANVLSVRYIRSKRNSLFVFFL
jgi:hypothetical protein